MILKIFLCIFSVLFVIGKSSYTYVKTSSENMLMKMFKCIWVCSCVLPFKFRNNSSFLQNAIVVKRRDGKINPRENLLDYSIEKCGTQLVHETRIMLKILVLYLPLPFFWSLLMQTGSRQGCFYFEKSYHVYT